MKPSRLLQTKQPAENTMKEYSTTNESISLSFEQYCLIFLAIRLVYQWMNYLWSWPVIYQRNRLPLRNRIFRATEDQVLPDCLWIWTKCLPNDRRRSVGTKICQADGCAVLYWLWLLLLCCVQLYCKHGIVWVESALLRSLTFIRFGVMACSLVCLLYIILSYVWSCVIFVAESCIFQQICQFYTRVLLVVLVY